MMTPLKHDGLVPLVLRPKDVRERTGLKPTLFFDLQNPRSKLFDAAFPKPFALSHGRARGYLTAEVDAWIHLRAATRTGEASA